MNTASIITFGAATVVGVIWFLLGAYPILRTSKKFKCERRFNTDELSREWILGHLQDAKDELLIISGNMNPLVYTQEFVDALGDKLAHGAQFTVKILCGPEVFTLNGDGNPLYQLCLNNPFPNLIIQFLPERPVHHFRVVDGAHVFVEDPHDPHARRRMIWTLDHSFFKGWMYKREFERRWDELGRIGADKVGLTPMTGGAS